MTTIKYRKRSFILCLFLIFIFYSTNSYCAEPDLEEIRVEALEGNAKFQVVLGMKYYYGEDVRQDYDRAFKWFKKAAEQGNVNGQFALANMYYEGKGIDKNYKEAFEWYKKAADQGYPKAYVLLGCMYLFGQSVEKNIGSAVHFFQQACSKGEPAGCALYEEFSKN